ncbi:MAG TPA: hypothetical protein VJV79_35940 [Polyangiaceae bacterium]|nr:hypothetical protein [Polyangiaceae bacterium]
MIIEKSGFLLMAGTLAAGGVGGWLAHDAKSNRERMRFAEPPTTAVPVVASAPSALPSAALVAQLAPALPACDDNQGTVEDCPAMGPADEGVCTNFAAKRCSEFKSAFKPKVAQAAVACVKTLKGNAACDPSRVNLCGHSALMAACPEPTPDPTQTDANGAVISAVTSACESIVKGCAGQALLPTLADCRQTLSGMTDFGRASMVECMAAHCGDKGLLGCEGTRGSAATR